MKIFFAVARIVAGVVLILYAAMVLPGFSGFLAMALGVLFMLGGLICAFLADKKYKKYFYILGGASVLAVLAPLSYIQFFCGGFLIYFAASLIAAALPKKSKNLRRN